MKKVLIFIGLCLSLSLTAQTDSVLFAAYQQEDMTVWKEAISIQQSAFSNQTLLIEYGYCGYIVAEAKKEGNEALLSEAKQCVQHFKSQITNHQSQMPTGHYEMYMSAVYVFELRLHESIHPFKAMGLAKDATQLAPNDPLVLSYYGTCLFYAPKPFGDKAEALKWFKKAKKHFSGTQWKYCWVRDMNDVYIRQCQEKLKKQ